MAERRSVQNASRDATSQHDPRDGGAGAHRDASYARVLLDHLARDCERFDRSSDWGPIVLWMAEEVRREAGSLHVPRETARRMLEQASIAQAKVLRPSA